MKKTILLIAALITLVANAQTHHVDADKAQRVASNFWLWHNTTPTRSDAWDIKTITFEGFDQLHIFDFNGSLENAKPENMDAMFETLEKYGKY